MSTETAVVVEKMEREPLFSKKNRRLLTDPIDADNPITVQVLGICSALAVTVQTLPSIIMSIGVVFVAAFSNLIVSMLRNTIPPRIRIIVQLVIVSLFVQIVSEVLKAYTYDIYLQLSVFVGLIITNCIIMGRLEAFALANKPWPSFLDGIGNGLGYGAILIAVGFVRELFGMGTIMKGTPIEWEVFSSLGIPFQANGIMAMPAGACIIVGLLIWAQRARNGYAEESN
jgi:Na+-transporting NADH:ubiquinone oxidoreductase subunit D